MLEAKISNKATEAKYIRQAGALASSQAVTSCKEWKSAADALVALLVRVQKSKTIDWDFIKIHAAFTDALRNLGKVTKKWEPQTETDLYESVGRLLKDPDSPESLSGKLRRPFNLCLCWSSVSVSRVKEIRKVLNTKKILTACDPIAGNGFLDSLLCSKLLGGDALSVSAFDKSPPSKTWCIVKEFVSSGKRLPFADEQLLLLSWPTDGDSSIEDILRGFKGQWVLYIGETGDCVLGNKGSCGTSNFFDLLKADWKVEHEFKMQRFPFIHDICVLFRRV
jgi:hypothetical protein